MGLVSRLRVICDSGFLVGLLVVVAGCAFVCLLVTSLLFALHCFRLVLFWFLVCVAFGVCWL